MADRIQVRRDTAANWASVNPTLAQGEHGYDTTTKRMKVGDGSTAWNSLPYFGDYLMPVDCTSRVVEITGDGIPLIPDNVAGITYFQDAFATVDSWVGNNATYNTVSVENGSLKVVYSGSPGMSMSACRAISGFNRKYTVIKIRSTVPISNVKYFGGSAYIDLTIRQLGSNSVLAFGVISSAHSSFLLSVNNGSTTPATAWYDTIYIGTGAYDTPALDRAGNGNDFTNTACTPVNGKYGKELAFNGTTSFLKASSPVIGTTGTIAVRFKSNQIAYYSVFCSNANSSLINGVSFFMINSVLTARFRNGEKHQDLISATVSDTAIYHTAILTFSNTEAKIYFDGGTVHTTTLTLPVAAGTNNLHIGSTPEVTDLFNGIISHFRYDFDIWTADEARAWYLNPNSVDSRIA